MEDYSTKKCILIRHAATDGNKEKRYIGCRTDEGLSQEGIDSCLHFRDMLSSLIRRYKTENESLNICTGPMKRAYETAGLLFPEAYVNVINELTEMDFGCFEGHNYEELNGNPDYQCFIDSGGTARIPGGESRDDFIMRSMRGFYRAMRDNADCLSSENPVCSTKDRSINVIVCHSGNIMAVMSSLTGGDYYDHHVNNLDGYILEYKLNDENISDLTYNRISDRLHC